MEKSKSPQLSEMTLRDHFAAAALPALVKTDAWGGQDAIAQRCYLIADAMLAERSK